MSENVCNCSHKVYPHFKTCDCPMTAVERRRENSAENFEETPEPSHAEFFVRNPVHVILETRTPA
jgi:hypothetical protein